MIFNLGSSWRSDQGSCATNAWLCWSARSRAVSKKPLAFVLSLFHTRKERVTLSKDENPREPGVWKIRKNKNEDSHHNGDILAL